MKLYENSPRSIRQLERNRRALAARLGRQEAPYDPACGSGFYDSLYLWDGTFAAWIEESEGYHLTAAKQLFSLTNHQRSDGLIPNMLFPPQKFTLNPERLMFTQPFATSDYSQPNEMAFVARQLYEHSRDLPPIHPDERLDSDIFLETIYPRLWRSYAYFIDHRQNSADDPLVYIIDPHETGRDSDSTYSSLKPFNHLKPPRSGELSPWHVNHRRRIIDYAGALALNFKASRRKWRPEAIREYFAPNDVMFNCQLARNYREMATIAGYLGHDGDVERFTCEAAALETAILGRMWFSEALDGRGAFYALHRCRPIKQVSISNLAPVMLENIRPEQLESILNLMDESFDVPFPLPSIPKDDAANYDPHYQEKDRHWQGPTWIVANRLVMVGLEIQVERTDLTPELRARCMEWLVRLDDTNHKLVEKGYFEHSNPINGNGQRRHKTLGHVFAIMADIRSRNKISDKSILREPKEQA